MAPKKGITHALASYDYLSCYLDVWTRHDEA